jgi:hypothetical protein
MTALTSPREEEEIFFCCQHSRAVEEQLFASVKPNRVWFLLEYAFPWGRKAFEESSLAAPIKNYLSNLLDETPESKLLFIKNQDSLFSERITFFVGVGSEVEPRLHRFALNDYADLLDVDVNALLSGGHFTGASIHSDPIYLVCTNGKRDQCCAKFGLEAYNQLVQYHQGETVWQTTHVGGHRFAGNVVCFPHGIYFGRVTEGDAKTLMDAYRSGEILLDKYRGRACYQPVVQAAEYYLRERTGEVGVGAYRHTGTEELAGDRWSVEFASVAKGKAYRLVIRSQSSDAGVFKSCADAEGVDAAQFRLVDIESR